MSHLNKVISDNEIRLENIVFIARAQVENGYFYRIIFNKLTIKYQMIIFASSTGSVSIVS